MFCSKCGSSIDDSAVVCIHCGVATQNMPNNHQYQQPYNQPIVINNTSSSSSSAAASAAAGYPYRRRSLLFDIFMILITGGLWIIWMIFRPKYY